MAAGGVGAREDSSIVITDWKDGGLRGCQNDWAYVLVAVLLGTYIDEEDAIANVSLLPVNASCVFQAFPVSIYRSILRQNGKQSSPVAERGGKIKSCCVSARLQTASSARPLGAIAQHRVDHSQGCDSVKIQRE